MAEQLNFVNAKMEHFVQERPSKALGPVPQAIAWSDGFKSHELSVPAVDGTLYGKMGKALWKSAPALTTFETSFEVSTTAAAIVKLNRHRKLVSDVSV